MAKSKLSRSPPSLSGGRETFPRLPLDDSGGSETPRRLGDGKVSEKLTSALVTSLSLSEPESLSSLSESSEEERPMLEMSRSEAWVGLVAFALVTGFF